jgi:hypothetical protein
MKDIAQFHHYLLRVALKAIPTIIATIVKPWAATRNLIMYCDIWRLPCLKLHKPYDRAPNVARQPEIVITVLPIKLCNICLKLN